MFWKKFFPGTVSEICFLHKNADQNLQKTSRHQKIIQLIGRIRTFVQKYPPLKNKYLETENTDGLAHFRSENQDFLKFGPAEFLKVSSVIKKGKKDSGAISPTAFITIYGNRLTAKEARVIFTGKRFDCRIPVSAEIIQTAIKKCSLPVVKELIKLKQQNAVTEKTLRLILSLEEEKAVELFTFIVQEKIMPRMYNTPEENSLEKFLSNVQFSKLRGRVKLQNYLLQAIDLLYGTDQFSSLEFFLLTNKISYTELQEILRLSPSLPIINLGNQIYRGQKISLKDFRTVSFFSDAYIYLALQKNYGKAFLRLLVYKNLCYLQVEYTEETVDQILSLMEENVESFVKDEEVPSLIQLYHRVASNEIKYHEILRDLSMKIFQQRLAKRKRDDSAIEKYTEKRSKNTERF
ncbi:MAG: hypothetical protein Tsb0015_13140 [Simkaniaceae bacterium]